MNDCCEKCRFWERGYEPQKGNCRRRSPVLCEGMNQWPVTESHDWCGEFEMREDVKPEQLKPEPKPCMNCGKPCGELEIFNAMTHGPFCGNCAHLIH